MASVDACKKPLYRPFVYKGKGKFKYSVYVKSDKNKCGRKIIHFGHVDYQQFYDKGGAFAHKNHLDPERRRLYRARASKIRDGNGVLTVKNKNTKNYWAYHYLW